MTEQQIPPELRYQYIREAIASLERQKATALATIAQSVNENSREARFLRITGVYLQTVEYTDREIARLTALLPCDAFIQKFNMSLHEAYREKYPINSRTTIAQWESPIGTLGTAYYRVSPPMQVRAYLPGETDIAFPPTRTLELKFEKWAYPFVLLCYEPTENKVWYKELETP